MAIAIRIARELGATVESLFGEIDDEASTVVDASWSGDARRRTAAAQSRVMLARVRGQVVAVAQPAAHLTLAPASGLLQRARRHRADVATFQLPDEIDATLLMSGCDPAATILVDWLARRRSPVRAVALPCSSREALRALVDGRAHVAGVHIRDQKSGEYNLASIRRAVGDRRSIVVNFARWELGLATAPGNPLAIRGFADLGRPGVRIVNREDGSGVGQLSTSRSASLESGPRESQAISSKSAAISRSRLRSRRAWRMPASPSGWVHTLTGCILFHIKMSATTL